MPVPWATLYAQLVDLAMERKLTRREQEVLALVAGGCTNREIADTLSLAEATVKVHMRNMCRLIGLRNRVELAIWHERNGPTPPMDEMLRRRESAG